MNKPSNQSFATTFFLKKYLNLFITQNLNLSMIVIFNLIAGCLCAAVEFAEFSGLGAYRRFIGIRIKRGRRFIVYLALVRWKVFRVLCCCRC